MAADYGPWPVYGQTRQIKILQQAVSSGNLSHAYLLYGLRGLGKKYITQCLLQQLFCERGTAACQDCPAGRRILAHTHSDVMYLPLPQATAISVDDIRTVTHFVSRSSESSQGYKCVVIERAEYLTSEASNALLKILEEAPPRVIIFLLAQHVSAIIPTIRSRCTLLKLLPLTDSEMRGWLSQFKLPAEQEDIVLAIAMGRPGRALDLIADNTVEYRRSIDTSWQLVRNSTADNFAWLKRWQTELNSQLKAGKWFSSSEQSLERINYLELVLRDLILGAINPTFILNNFMAAELQQELRRLTLAQLLSLMAALRQLRYNIRQNVNVTLAWEYFFLQINQLKQTA
ncbi:MAG: hypothetical protein V1846_01805 [Candidatus Komeilibacteria bacterium]